MKTHQRRTRYLLILSAARMAAAPVLALGVMPEKHSSTGQQQAAKPAPKLPLIISNVKKLEVISATIQEEDGQYPAVVLEIRNKSDVAVTAILIESGDEINTSGISRQGDDEDGNPRVVIEPRGTIKMMMVLSDVIPGAALRVAGATYADGTEEGEKSALRSIHGQRARDKAERDQQKGIKTP